eukprot:Skav220540  [mRNA]  locus=scaffold1683:90303:96059:- [translate_table: standard]
MAVPPPLIISDASCLDIAEELRRRWGKARKVQGSALPLAHRLTAKREIFVVTELLDFDAEGAARFGVASQRPHCMTLRGDLQRFVQYAAPWQRVYMMAQNDSLAAKAMPWHWDQREIQMSIAASRLEKIGHHMRQGPTYVVKIKNDRRSAERKQIVEKTEVHYGFGTLRAYHHRKQLEAADELIKATLKFGKV